MLVREPHAAGATCGCRLDVAHRLGGDVPSELALLAAAAARRAELVGEVAYVVPPIVHGRAGQACRVMLRYVMKFIVVLMVWH